MCLITAMLFKDSHMQTLLKSTGYLLVLFVFSLLGLINKSEAQTCEGYLKPALDFPFENWPIADRYKQLSAQIEVINTDPTVAQFVSLYRDFVSGYHERYNLQLEALAKAYPELDDDIFALRKSLGPFYKIEQKVLTRFRSEILKLPAKKRMQFLRRQSPKKLVPLEHILSALMGLEQNPGDDLFTPWSSHLKVLNNIEPQAKTVVVEYGSNVGRFGLLLGLLYPDVTYYGFELNLETGNWASEAARKNGFLNLKFVAADSDLLLNPNFKAYHIYVNGPIHPNIERSISVLLQNNDPRSAVNVYSFEALESFLIQENFRNLRNPEVFTYESL